MHLILPSRWKLALIDVLFILIVAALIVRFAAPTSGFSHAMQTGAHLLATFVMYVATYLAQFLNWI